MIEISELDLSVDQDNYLPDNDNFEEYHLELTDTYFKNKKRYTKKSFHPLGCIAYDTETFLGTCKLICRNEGIIKSLYNPTFDEILEFLLYRGSNGLYYRFFYNLGFDVTAILKTWNNIEQIKLLKEGHKVKYNEYTLSYIQNKMFTVKKGKKVVVFTDLWQFYKMKLNEAGWKYLGQRKLDNVNAELMNTDETYWELHKSDIIKYCIMDCEILAELGKILVKNAIELELELPRYICSSASFSKAFFMKMAWLPNLKFIPQSIMELSHYCYYGGRFEVLQRGAFEYLEVYDKVSQYPTKIRELPSFKYGRWVQVKKLPKEETYGFYRVKLDIPENCSLPTIPIRDKIIKFPIGYFEGWFTWYDLDLVRQYITEIIEGWEYWDSGREYYPFKDKIESLFEKKANIKQQLKKKMKIREQKQLEVQYLLSKLCMNGLYGCFIEIHKHVDGKRYGGKLFHPLYACMITAYGRWSVLKDMKKEDYSSIVAIHTDSLILNKPISYLNCNDELGGWNKENSGKGFVFGTGQYQVNEKIAIRSFSKIDSWFALVEKYAKNRQKIRFVVNRMMKMAKALIQDKNIDKANIMKEEKKFLMLNSDEKRNWKFKYKSFGQMLKKVNTSTPIRCLKYYDEYELS